MIVVANHKCTLKLFCNQITNIHYWVWFLFDCNLQLKRFRNVVINTEENPKIRNISLKSIENNKLKWKKNRKIHEILSIFYIANKIIEQIRLANRTGNTKQPESIDVKYVNIQQPPPKENRICESRILLYYCS